MEINEKSIGNAKNLKLVCVTATGTNNLDKEYLDSELKRIGQSRLIGVDEFINSLVDITSGDINSGDIYRIDVKDDKLWVEKMY